MAVFDAKAIEPKQNFEQVDATPTWVQTGAQPFGVLASPDGRRVYTANYGSDSVTVIDTTAKPNPVPVYNVGAGDGPYQLALSPDGGLLYSSNEGNAISIVDTGSYVNRKDILVPFQPNETPARFECTAVVTLPSCVQ